MRLQIYTRDRQTDCTALHDEAFSEKVSSTQVTRRDSYMKEDNTLLSLYI